MGRALGVVYPVYHDLLLSFFSYREMFLEHRAEMVLCARNLFICYFIIYQRVRKDHHARFSFHEQGVCDCSSSAE